MKNFLKSFVALFMVAVLGIGVSVPAMAADYEMAGTELEAVSMTETDSRAGTQVGGMAGQADIRPGASLGTCFVSSRAKTIEVTLKDISGIVILRFTNQDTGDFRSFTAIGGQTHSLEYVSSMDAGNWNVSVLLCDNNANNCRFDIKFFR